MPNNELNVASVEISSTSFVSETIPVPQARPRRSLSAEPQSPQLPATASKQSAQPTPATVLSVSDVLPTQGTIALPPVNQTAAASSSDSFAPGRPESTSETGNGTVTGKQNGSGSGADSGDHGNQSDAATGPDGENGAETGSNSGPDSGLSSGNGQTIGRITRPRDGHFGVVVVGASVAEEYPEAVGIWADRLAYTVYLRVGAAKSWILQYCLPRVKKQQVTSLDPTHPGHTSS